MKFPDRSEIVKDVLSGKHDGHLSTTIGSGRPGDDLYVLDINLKTAKKNEMMEYIVKQHDLIGALNRSLGTNKPPKAQGFAFSIWSVLILGVSAFFIIFTVANIIHKLTTKDGIGTIGIDFILLALWIFNGYVGIKTIRPIR